MPDSQLLIWFLNPFTLIGAKRYSKSAWKSFKIEFTEIEESISEAKDEVTEELQLASEQEAQAFRHLLTAEIEENRTLRIKQLVEIQENRDFRSQQSLVIQRTEARQIQKILKEEGNLFELSKRINIRPILIIRLLYIERRKIRLLRHVPSHDYTISLNRARALRCEGTCRWVLDRAEFQNWIDQWCSKHLWCYGIRMISPNYTQWLLYCKRC